MSWHLESQHTISLRGIVMLSSMALSEEKPKIHIPHETDQVLITKSISKQILHRANNTLPG